MGRRSRIRLESALRREKPGRRPGKSILIVCEGEETEPIYFKSLWRDIRLRTVDVKVVGQGAEILGVVDAAVHLRDERANDALDSVRMAPYDEVWCVVDTERRTDSPSWERGVDRAAAHGLRLAWSNPCFEYWLLLHFELIGRSFDGYAAIRPFVSRHIRHYTKSTDCFELLAPRIPTAVDHSKRIHRSQWQDTPRSIDCNPATTVHELVERLIEVAGMTVEQYQGQHPLPAPVRPKDKRSRQSSTDRGR